MKLGKRGGQHRNHLFIFNYVDFSCRCCGANDKLNVDNRSLLNSLSEICFNFVKMLAKKSLLLYAAKIIISTRITNPMNPTELNISMLVFCQVRSKIYDENFHFNKKISYFYQFQNLLTL